MLYVIDDDDEDCPKEPMSGDVDEGFNVDIEGVANDADTEIDDKFFNTVVGKVVDKTAGSDVDREVV
ncbi:uncharacterized protein ColSpa_05058 [Colletotrichum spaethianum]|uniref:Uncharacterized protein n=1 Tax=Colletotrichum spaethianum TaxID=700344 RepID=A0AA37LIX7_9PEZI|nr:uncharacterized protein ColSpa_05058 [Colletotrichum spaethianum]GKT44877.1 hypothetical protein ColSpa_05058 [Colletotrichum spaethianum]